VAAYICGHTHNHSVVNIAGVWQVDAGHSRGKADPGARSTFVRIHVGDSQISYETYRVNTLDYCEYILTDRGSLNRPASPAGRAEPGLPMPLLSVRAVVVTLVATALIVSAARQLARSGEIRSES
jgi:hypothetical protein